MFQPEGGDRTPRRMADLPLQGASPWLSRDLRWLVYRNQADGEAYVQRFPSGAGRWQVFRGGSVDRGADLRLHWSPATSQLFQVHPNNSVFSVKLPADETSTAALDEPTRILRLPPEAQLSGMTPHPDGSRFLAAREVTSPRGRDRIVAVLNWFDELKTKAPARATP